MGALTDSFVLIMLAIVAVVFVALLLAAFVSLARSPYSTYQKFIWTPVLLFTGPIGLVIWYSVGLKSARRTHEIDYQRRWRKTTQVNTTISDEKLASISA